MNASAGMKIVEIEVSRTIKTEEYPKGQTFATSVEIEVPRDLESATDSLGEDEVYALFYEGFIAREKYKVSQRLAAKVTGKEEAKQEIKRIVL